MKKLSTLAVAFLMGCVFAAQAVSQDETPQQLKERATGLLSQTRLVEALPLYEKLATLMPKDSQVQLGLGFALLGNLTVTKDPAARKDLRLRARAAFVRARELGDESVTVQGFISGIDPDGREPAGFSNNVEADRLMNQAEAAFAQGKMDDALAAYQAALKLDPQCYEAALFSGDVYVSQQKYDEAEKWYQRAIQINPYRETAYRYSATPLMKQNKTQLARDRYIEAYITEPYSKFAIGGFIQWGDATHTGLGHPKIDVPQTKTGPDGKPTTDINITSVDDGSMAWISYTATRETWSKTKFAATFPKEKTYRHSVAEEADALRAVVATARTLKPKALNSQIAMIDKMDKDGLLEAYILLARADSGIAADFDDYLRSHRDKLRQYVLKYVVQGGDQRAN